MIPLPRWAILAIGAVLILLALFLIGRCSAPSARDAVALDRADAVSEAANRVLDAERVATANQMARDEAQRNEIQELKEIAREADTGDGVGNSTRAVLERLRSQQAARGGAGSTR